MPRAAQEYLDKNGSKQVTSITVCRSPIEQYINTVLNWISTGEFEKKKKELNIERMFHLYMVVTLDGKTGSTIVEKNENIEIYDNTSTNKVAESSISVNLWGSTITLDQLIFGGLKKLEDLGLNPYNYDGINNNCQKFLKAILDYFNLSTKESNDFIVQNTEKIIGELPYYAQNISQGAINLKQAINILLKGGKMHNTKLDKLKTKKK